MPSVTPHPAPARCFGCDGTSHQYDMCLAHTGTAYSTRAERFEVDIIRNHDLNVDVVSLTCDGIDVCNLTPAQAEKLAGLLGDAVRALTVGVPR